MRPEPGAQPSPWLDHRPCLKPWGVKQEPCETRTALGGDGPPSIGGHPPPGPGHSRGISKMEPAKAVGNNRLLELKEASRAIQNPTRQERQLSPQRRCYNAPQQTSPRNFMQEQDSQVGWVFLGCGGLRNTPVSLQPRAGLASYSQHEGLSQGWSRGSLCLIFWGAVRGEPSPVLISFHKEVKRKPRGETQEGERPTLESLEENFGCTAGKDPAATTRASKPGNAAQWPGG